MTARIPQAFIDELMQRADIVDVIGSRLQLKKAGREYKACCPFHGEKTPSFTVSPAKGFYHCFGCGAHGTALGFLMEYDRLDFVSAVEALAERLGLEVPREATSIAPLAPLYETLARAAAFFERALRTHAPAIDYLRSRGIDGDTARAFRVGYAPAAWDALLRESPDTVPGRQQLAAAGLVIEREGGEVESDQDEEKSSRKKRSGRNLNRKEMLHVDFAGATGGPSDLEIHPLRRSRR